MREILFRGQTRRRGEKIKMSGEPVESNWVYGGIFPTDNGDHAIIYQQEPEIKKYPVYADTVGQYMGLKDKNGVRIFEGDIIRQETEMFGGKYVSICEVIYYNGRLCLRRISDGTMPLGFTDSKTMTVLGNIYDNPELMEGEDDE